MAIITADNGVQYDSRYNLQAANQEAWDKGEARDPGLALNAAGQHMLYSANTPAWHALGATGDAVGKHETMRRAGFVVDGRPLTFRKVPAEFQGEVVPDSFWVVNDHDGRPFGNTVGRQFTVVQPSELADFAEAIIGESGEEITYESMGGLRDRHGRIRSMFVSLRLDPMVLTDLDGREDVIFWFLMLRDSYDGSGSVGAAVTPWRPVCRNSERFALRDAHTTWKARHTSTVTDRVVEARTSLRLATKARPAFQEEAEILYRMQVSQGEARDLIASLYPLAEDASKRKTTMRNDKVDAMVAIYDGPETGDSTRGTRWGVEQAVGHWLDHYSQVRPAQSLSEDVIRGQRMIEGWADEERTRVHRALRTLTVR